jgi:hypothetical protein
MRGSNAGWDTEEEKDESKQGAVVSLWKAELFNAFMADAAAAATVEGKRKRKADGPPAADGAPLPEAKRRRKAGKAGKAPMDVEE